MKKEIIEKYDGRGNMIYYENPNLIHCNVPDDFPDTFRVWREFDKNNNCIHYKNNQNIEIWYGYNENNYQRSILKEEFEQIKEQEFLGREEVQRFELMEL